MAVPRQEISLPRRIGRVHWRGLWTHYLHGLQRFMRFGVEAVVGPVLSSLLFLLVFAIAVADTQVLRGGTSFLQFLAPGIAAFTLIHGSFQYAAFPIVDDKLEGGLQDLLMSPLAPWEVAAGYVLAAASGGLIVGGMTLAVAWSFVPLPMPGAAWVLLFAGLAALLFACLGAVVGLWAEKWDQLSVADTFLMLPLAFLSGAFFTLDSVPAVGRVLIQLNPVFYAIDGVRRGALGWSASEPLAGAAIVLTLVLVMGALAWRLFAVGYKIKP